MPTSPKSKYPQALAFASENPLPRSAQGLADGILDVASILVACKGDQARHWSSMSLDLIYNGYASAYPGAFLSNPALLLNTASAGPYGASLGSHGAGCFFSYAHYQEDSLGTALLLPAFSPRTHKPKKSAKQYAKAILLLREQGSVCAARLNMLADGASLEKLASGEIGAQDARHAYMTLEFDAPRIAGLGHLRTDLACKAIELALSDDKAGLFSDSARARLGALCIGRAAFNEAASIAESTGAGGPKRGSPRV